MTPRLFAVVMAALALPACKKPASGGIAPLASASAHMPAASSSASAGSFAVASAPAASASGAPAAPGPPSGAGVTAFGPIEETKDCAAKSRDLEPNLAFGGIGIAGRGKEFAVVWHYVSGKKGEGLIAFSGYDASTHPIAVAHGLGKGTPFRARVFPRKDAWFVTWFDAHGLMFANANWSPNLPKGERLSAVTADEAGDTAIIATKGALLGAAALGPGKTEQLGLFLFAPEEGGDPVKAIAATHHAVVPEHPAVAELDGERLLAWDDEVSPGVRSVVVTRFGPSGKESPQETLSTPGVASTLPTIVATGSTALVAWVEQQGQTPVIVSRALDGKGRPSGPSYKVSSGTKPTLAATADGAVLSYLMKSAPDAPAQVVAVKIGPTGEPAAKGYLISDLLKGKGNVAETAGVAYASDEDRVGFVWTYVDGMRGHMTTAKVVGCF